MAPLTVAPPSPASQPAHTRKSTITKILQSPRKLLATSTSFTMKAVQKPAFQEQDQDTADGESKIVSPETLQLPIRSDSLAHALGHLPTIVDGGTKGEKEGVTTAGGGIKGELDEEITAIPRKNKPQDKSTDKSGGDKPTDDTDCNVKNAYKPAGYDLFKDKYPQNLTSHEESKDKSNLVPALRLQRISGGTQTPSIDDSPDPPAKWYCCHCGRSNDIWLYSGPNPIGALACECPHKSCSSCTTSGLVKPFLPIEEPAMVPCFKSTDPSTPVSEDGKAKDIRFGIVCSYCGLSWRAREIGNRFTKTLRKMPSVSLSHAVKLNATEGKLRKSRSTLVLGSKRIVTPPERKLPKQAEYATVRFSGGFCTCDERLDLAGSMCFQIVDKPPVEPEPKLVILKSGSKVGWTTTPDCMEHGHGTPILRFGRVRHPNPLRSCPPVDEDAKQEWEAKCAENGWM